MRVNVRVMPRSSKNEMRWEGDSLKVRLTAPPVDGAANAALLKFLAARLKLPQSALQIVQGATSRQKVIQIDGMTHDELVQRLLPGE